MAISDTAPAKSYTNNGQTVFPFNIRETQVTDAMTGKARTQYEYDEARVDGEVTREKLIAAQIAAIHSIEAEIALINNKLADPIKNAAEYAAYQSIREAAKSAAAELLPVDIAARNVIA